MSRHRLSYHCIWRVDTFIIHQPSAMVAQKAIDIPVPRAIATAPAM
ncbi:MAG: hypothetical protein AAFR31_17480 [Cyanobacteria bacterium J06627_8]